MFDVSSRAKLSVSALAERKIASARPRKYGLLLRAEEEMLLYGQALARATAANAGFGGGGAVQWHRRHVGDERSCWRQWWRRPIDPPAITPSADASVALCVERVMSPAAQTPGMLVILVASVLGNARQL